MKDLIIQYNGKESKGELVEFFKQINKIVQEANLPTNLYTKTGSPLDLVIIDFKEFDLNEVKISENNIFISPIDSKYHKNINHVILHPSSILTVKFDILPTAETEGSPVYDYFAVRLSVKH